MKHLVTVTLLCLLARPIQADRVTYQTRAGKEQTRNGTILDYDGQQLTLQVGAREVTIPSEQVQSVDTEWLTGQQQADALSAKGEYAAAIQQYRLALTQEKRRWVQRRIMASLVRCHQNQGDILAACTSFFRLLKEDHDSPFFDVIPLAWRPQQTSTRLRRSATQWVGDDDEPVRSLVGASWLLSTNSRSSSIAALRLLARHSDKRVQQLAKAQLWRTTIVTADANRVAIWMSQISDMPPKLRAGPYYVVGRAQARLGNHDQAALAFLRVPILYASDRVLVQGALIGAAQALDRESSRSEAIALYRQAMEIDSNTVDGRQAQSRLRELGLD